MAGPAATALRALRHPVQPRLCAPAAGIAVGAVLVLRLLVEVRPAWWPFPG